MAGFPVYLHELLEDSSVHLPHYEPPPRVSVTQSPAEVILIIIINNDRDSSSH